MNKKKIISQLATVTLLSSTLVTTVGVVNPGLVSVKSWAENGVNEEGLYLDPGKRLTDGFEISATSVSPLLEQLKDMSLLELTLTKILILKLTFSERLNLSQKRK